MKRCIKVLLLLVSLFPFAGKSQQTIHPDSLLNKFSGKWVLRGTIDGQETVHDIVAQRVLNGQYLRFTEVSREKDKSGRPIYDAEVFICWQQAKEQYFCLWLDNTSNEGITNQVLGRAKQNGDKIEFLFTYGNGARFHTHFLYDRKADSWQWLMDGEENGKLVPFARVTLTKK